MQRRMVLVAIVAAIATLTFAAAASATTIKGKVVHKNRSAHSYVVAKKTGQMLTVHAKKSPALGRRVVVQARLLANGTYGQRGIQTGRLTHTAKVHGVVTFINARGTKFAVSAKGVSLVVHKAATAKAAGRLAVGDIVTVRGTLDDDGDIDCTDCSEDGVENGYIELEGHILAVDAASRTLTLSADDCRELAGTVTLLIPADWDMTMYAVGDELEVTATLNADGTYTAVGASKDGDEEEADDEDCSQGEDLDEIEGIVAAVDTTLRTVTLTADDDDCMVGATVTVVFPAELDMSSIEVGSEIEVEVTQNADGTYTAVCFELDDEGEVID